MRSILYSWLLLAALRTSSQSSAVLSRSWLLLAALRTSTRSSAVLSRSWLLLAALRTSTRSSAVLSRPWLLLAALRTSSRSSRILPRGHDSSLRRCVPAVRVSRLWFSFSIEDAEERAGVLAHAVRSFLEILPAGRGEVVVARAAVCFRHTPPRAHELLLFEAMQCLIQRGAFDR